MTEPLDIKHIALTGASGGLGRGLALALARPGLRFSLAGRDRQRLETLARELERRKASAEACCFDIRDRRALEGWMKAAHSREPLDLVIANAGVTAGSEAGELEAPEDLDRILSINAQAAIRTAALAAALMKPGGRGRIVLISSLGALWPLPTSPAYCASKAAVRMYGRALRAWAAPWGLKVTVVCPGYIDTPMSGRLVGPKPLTWSVEKTARHIVKKLATWPEEITFPRVLVFGLRLLPFLPEKLAAFFIGRFANSIQPDAESPRWKEPQ